MYVSKSIIASTLVLALSSTAFAAPASQVPTATTNGQVVVNNGASAPLPTVTVYQTVDPSVYAAMQAAQATPEVEASSGVTVADQEPQVDYSTVPLSTSDAESNSIQADTAVSAQQPTATVPATDFDFGTSDDSSTAATAPSTATQQGDTQGQTVYQASTAGAATTNTVNCSKWYSSLRYLSCSSAGRKVNSMLGRPNAVQTTQASSAGLASSARPTATPTASAQSSATSVMTYAGSSAASRVAQVGLTVAVLAVSGTLAF